MKKLILLTLLPVILFGCATTKTLNSSEVMEDILKQPKIEIGKIEIIDYKNLPGDTNLVRDFLKNIILSKEHQLSTNPDYILNLSIKEQSYSKKLDVIFTTTVTISFLTKSTGKIVYRGILIKEGKDSLESSYYLFKIIKEAYSKFKSNCKKPRQEVVSKKE